MRTLPITSPFETPTESTNRVSRDGYFDTVRRLGRSVASPGAAIRPSAKSGGGVFVPYSSYGGFKIEEDKCVISCAPGTVFTGQITVSGTLVLSDAMLECDGNTPALLITETGRLILRSCQVSKDDGSQLFASDSYIHVETGGFLSVNGCIFHGDQADIGTLVQHDDALNAPRVAVVGSMNLTDVVTTPYVNVGYIQDVP